MKKVLYSIILLILALSFFGCKIQTPVNEPIIEQQKEEVNATDTPEEDDTIRIITSDISFITWYLRLGEEKTNLINKYHFEVKKIKSEGYKDYIDDITVRLIAGDNSFDIYFLKPWRMECRPIIENGYFVDLGEFTNLHSEFELMFNKIKSESTYNNKYFGLPTYIYAKYFLFDNDKLAEHDLTVADINTYDDLINKHELIGIDASDNFSVSGDYNRIFIEDVLFLNFDYKTYSIDFNSIDLGNIKNIYDNLKNSSINKEYLENNDVFNYIGLRHDYSVNTLPINYSIKPLYLDNTNNTFGLGMTFHMINPNSNKIDDSANILYDFVQFLKSDTAPQMPSLENYSEYLYKDINTYESIEGFTKKIYVTQERLDSFDEVLESGKCQWKFPGYDECAEILNKYYNDEIEEDVAKQQMQKIMDTVSREYTLD